MRSAIVVHLTLYIFTNKVDDYFKLLEPVWNDAVTQPQFLSFQVSQGASVDGVTAIRPTEVWNATLDWLMTVRTHPPHKRQRPGLELIRFYDSTKPPDPCS